MSQQYDSFKRETIEANDVIQEAMKLRAVTPDFADGFAKGMWEAREIYMRLESESDRDDDQL